MSTVDDTLARVLDIIQLELIEPAETTILKHYIREALWDLRSKRNLWAENTVEFTLATADPPEYRFGGGDDVPNEYPPADVMQIERLESLVGTNYVPVQQVDLTEIRELQRGGTSSSNRPQKFAWWASKLILWPALSGDVDFRMDYIRDPTLGAGGDAFDETDSPNTFSNHYFRTHRGLIVSYALIRWGLGRGRDPELAQNQTAVYNKELGRMYRELALAKIPAGSQMAGHL